MRLFIAIEFSPELREEIQRWMRSLADEIPDPEHRLRWVKDEQLHLTLKFLGEVREDQLKPLSQVLRERTRDHMSFSLSAARVGHFGGRVVWLGLETGLDNVASLAKSIEEGCASIGFTLENRRFHPHITLARSKVNPGTIRLANLPLHLRQKSFPPFRVTSISLIQSTLSARGSLYETLERFPLS